MQRSMYIKVKVAAGVKKELFKALGKDSFSASVREPAERNLANMRVRELVAAHFGVSLGVVKIISGHHSPSKILSINIPD